MRLFSRRTVHKSRTESGVVDISEENGVRSLHLGSHTVQSSMRLSQPWALELDYSRRMMGFLLFKPEPRDVLMIGLGGGSIPKFIHHTLPHTRVHTVELNPQVVAAAKNYFFLPDESERFSIEIGDGAEYVQNHPEAHDIVLVDGFDGHALAEELITQDFYDRCAQTLTRDGIFGVNLWRSDPRFESLVERIGNSFDHRILLLPTARRGNIAVFGFRQGQGSPRWDDLRLRARSIEALTGLPFIEFVNDIRDYNDHSEKRLLF